MLQQENLKSSRVGIHKFLKANHTTGLIGRRPGSGRPSKITAEIKEIVEAQMRIDDETTAYQLFMSSISLFVVHLWRKECLGVGGGWSGESGGCSGGACRVMALGIDSGTRLRKKRRLRTKTRPLGVLM